MSENISSHSLAENGGHPARQANLDLLRCVAMMMVIVLHYLGKGNLLADPKSPTIYPAEWLPWLLECFCCVAVNVYMFISGYFLCTSSFRPGRLIRLWLQVWLYSVIFGLIGALTGVMAQTEFDTHFILTLLFPISMKHYWFMTAYIFLYILLPFIGSAVRKMTKRQMQIAVLLLLFVFCLQKSVLPVRLETDSLGYDCLWYLSVFTAAAYVRRFGIPLMEKKAAGIVLYTVCSLLVLAEMAGLRQIYLRTGMLEGILKVSLEYNHILLFLAAVGLFAAFQRIKLTGRPARFVCKIAPYTLGVYLLHENLGLRYTWQNWFGADKLLTQVPASAAADGIASDMGVRMGLAAGDTGRFLLYTLAAVVCVFTAGILTDMLRAFLTRGLDRALGVLPMYRRLKGFVQGLDEHFREKEPA